MVLLKELSNNKTSHPTVTLELDYNAVCDLHNILCEAAKNKTSEAYDTLALEFTNIFEMMKHGFLTDFGIYKNAKYFDKYNSFDNYK